MEFWGVEVKSGEPFTFTPGEDKVLHLSQASLGEVKKNKPDESICIFVEVDGKKLVLGTLNSDKLPQQVFDLVFDKEFQLSHSSKKGSVYFYGYTARNPFDESDNSDVSDFDDDIRLHSENNGRQETKAKEVKPAAADKTNTKQVAKTAVPKKNDDSDDSDSEDGSDSHDSDSDDSVDSSLDSSSDDLMGESSDEDDESSDEEEDEKPKMVQNNNKRPNGPDTNKTPKRMKQTGPNVSGTPHVDTPHPAAKKAAKTPKAEGSHTCEPCKKSFKSEGALDSHTKAKHSGGK